MPSSVADRAKLVHSGEPPDMLNEELLASVAAQMLAGKEVTLEGETVPVKRTSAQRLKNLRFRMNGREYHAIEQNPDKPSRWGRLAREGHHVVQFRDVASSRYVAVAIDGKIKQYSRLSKNQSDHE